MIRVRQTFGAHTGRTADFDRSVIRFGRRSDCDFVFDPQADRDASGRHAEIRLETEHWVLVDLGSRNGTWLNGRRIETERLSPGDVIEFGSGGPRVTVELVPAAGVRPAAAAAQTDPSTPVDADDAATPHPDASAARHSPSDPSSPSRPGQDPTPGRRRSTTLLRAIAMDVVQHSLFRLKIALGCTMLMLGATIAALAVVVLGTDLGPDPWIGPESGRDKGATHQAARTKDARPSQGAAFAKRLAEEKRNALYLLRYEEQDVSTPLCTAFAVKPDLLATAASCVVELERHRRRGARVGATRTGRSSAVRVTSMWRHPAYEQSTGRHRVDVGLVRLDGRVDGVLRLASMARVSTLEPGDHLYVYGFSGGTDGGVPVPVTETTRLEGTRDVEVSGYRATLLDHGGSAGSHARGAPVFGESSTVVGLQLGGRLANGRGAATRIDAVLSLVAGLGR